MYLSFTVIPTLRRPSLYRAFSVSYTSERNCLCRIWFGTLCASICACSNRLISFSVASLNASDGSIRIGSRGGIGCDGIYVAAGVFFRLLFIRLKYVLFVVLRYLRECFFNVLGMSELLDTLAL